MHVRVRVFVKGSVLGAPLHFVCTGGTQQTTCMCNQQT